MAKRHITRTELEAFLPDLFGSLSKEEANLILSNLRIRAYKTGETIYREGDNPKCLHCLLEGKIKITRQGVGKREQILRLISSVDYFGLSAALARENYSSTSTVLVDSTVALIPLEIFLPLLESNASLASIVAQRVSKTLQLCYRRTVNLTQKHIRGRLAEGILYMKEVFGVNDEGFIDCQLSREELAYLCNMTGSNSIRTLSLLARENILQVIGRSIRILNEPKLTLISEQG